MRLFWQDINAIEYFRGTAAAVIFHDDYGVIVFIKKRCFEILKHRMLNAVVKEINYLPKTAVYI